MKKLLSLLIVLSILALCVSPLPAYAQSAPLSFNCFDSYYGTPRGSDQVLITYLGSNSYQFDVLAGEPAIYCFITSGAFRHDGYDDAVSYSPRSPDNSGGIWYFAGGGSVNGPNPLGAYNYAGFYWAWTGGTTSISVTVTLLPLAGTPIAEFDVVPESGTTSDTFEFTDTSDANYGTITAWAWDFDDGSSSSDANPDHNFADRGVYDVELCVTNEVGTDCVVHAVDVSGIYRPLADEDIDSEFGIFDIATYPGDETNPLATLYGPDPNLVIAMSDNIGDRVYAIESGLVIDVSPVEGNYCFGLVNVLGYCMLRFDPDAVAGTSYVASDYFFVLDRTNLFRVLVQSSLGDGGEILEYIVADALTYVRIGLEITAGCILGKTTELEASGPLPLGQVAANVGIFEATISSPNTSKGVMFLALIDDDTLEYLPLLSLMTESVDPGQACNRDPDTASCLFDDPNLEHGDQWLSFGGVQWLANGGAILQPGGQIMYDGLPLVSSTAYSMTVIAQRLGQSGSSQTIQLALGTTTSSNFDMVMLQTQYAIASATHDPDRGSLYSARVINTGNAPLQVISLCISAGSADVTPDTCYFSNYSFDQNRTDWDYTGTVNNGLLAGEIAMQDNATIAQTVHLYPNGASPHTYVVTIHAAIASGQEANSATVSFTGRYPSTEEADNIEFILVSNGATEYPLSSFYQWQGREVVFQAEVSISTETTSDFVIRLNLSDSSSVPIFIREVCINDPFSHHPTGGGGRVWVPSNCGGRISPPADLSDFGSWTFWLWQNTDAFYQCDLMPMLQRMFNVVYDIGVFGRWQMLYWESVGRIYSNWIGNSLIPWLGGNFTNIANGRITTVSDGGGTCSDLWCVLSALIEQVIAPIVNSITQIVGLLLQAAALLLDVLTMLISLIFSVVNALLSLFNGFISLITGFVGALNNATPVPLPLLPTCQLDPAQSGFCLFLWGLENTIFADEGIIILWLILGYYSIRVLLWLILAYGNNISDASRSL